MVKILGIDYGTKRVGLALSDDEGKFAFPNSIKLNDKRLVEDIANLSKSENVEEIVIGESRNQQGEENVVMEKARPFAEEIEKATGLRVVFEQEFMTSQYARDLMGKNDTIDAHAAALILQRYLDKKNEKSILEE